MAIPPRLASQGTFFVTAATADRRRLFTVERNADLFLETLRTYRSAGHFKLFDFVVMPDHIHLILQPRGITLERAMQFVKGGFSHNLASRGPVWQKGFTDHRIRDREDFDVRRAYVRENPVRAGLAARPEAYRWSSAFVAGNSEEPYLSG